MAYRLPFNIAKYSCRMIKESGLKIIPFDDLDEAAAKAVQLTHA